ncbi:hypothetical protein Tco_0988053 [Tanacetum coccineum]|uniref:Uncharacterized protein n=1 Tax=Tanacetum coccineum TaxID=301880 RepID=A0ABQ5EPW1_9ASTR
MIRLRDLGANTLTGVPYPEEQIMAMVRKGKHRGHIPGVGRVLARHCKDAISINEPRGTYIDTDVDEIKEDSKRLRKELDLLRTVVRSDDRMSQLLTQLESQHEVGGGSRARMRTSTRMRRFRTYYPDDMSSRKTIDEPMFSLIETVWAQYCRPEK